MIWGREPGPIVKRLIEKLREDNAPHMQVGAFLIAHGLFTEGGSSPHPVAVGNDGILQIHPHPFRSFFRRNGAPPADLPDRLTRFVGDALRRLVTVDSTARCDQGDHHEIAIYRVNGVLICRLPLKHLWISDSDLEMYDLSFSQSCIDALERLDKERAPRIPFREIRRYSCIHG